MLRRRGSVAVAAALCDAHYRVIRLTQMHRSYISTGGAAVSAASSCEVYTYLHEAPHTNIGKAADQKMRTLSLLYSAAVLNLFLRLCDALRFEARFMLVLPHDIVYHSVPGGHNTAAASIYRSRAILLLLRFTSTAVSHKSYEFFSKFDEYSSDLLSLLLCDTPCVVRQLSLVLNSFSLLRLDAHCCAYVIYHPPYPIVFLFQQRELLQSNQPQITNYTEYSVPLPLKSRATLYLPLVLCEENVHVVVDYRYMCMRRSINSYISYEVLRSV